MNPEKIATIITTSPCTELLGCNILLITTLITWFSVTYSTCRVMALCCWLLHHSDIDIEEDPENPEVEKNECLWGIAGVLLISYELVLSIMLCIGTGSFVFEVKGVFIFIWCVNYPVFLTLHWVLGFFLTKCCSAHVRMKRASSYNCMVVLINLCWRAWLYWGALTVLIHYRTNANNSSTPNPMSGTAQSLSS